LCTHTIRKITAESQDFTENGPGQSVTTFRLGVPNLCNYKSDDTAQKNDAVCSFRFTVTNPRYQRVILVNNAFVATQINCKRVIGERTKESQI